MDSGATRGRAMLSRRLRRYSRDDFSLCGFCDLGGETFGLRQVGLAQTAGTRYIGRAEPVSREGRRG